MKKAQTNSPTLIICMLVAPLYSVFHICKAENFGSIISFFIRETTIFWMFFLLFLFLHVNYAPTNSAQNTVKYKSLGCDCQKRIPTWVTCFFFILFTIEIFSLACYIGSKFVLFWFRSFSLLIYFNFLWLLLLLMAK